MKNSSSATEVLAFLETDAESKYPRYPDQAVPALKDERVAKLVDERLKGGQSLADVVDLGYNIYTGVNSTMFAFSRPGNEISSSAILVLEKAENCEIFGVVEDFDPGQPNKLLPSFPRRGAQPFVLAQPSVTEGLVYNKRILGDADERTRTFLGKFGFTKSVIDGDGTLASTNCVARIPTTTIVAPSLMGEPYPSVEDICEVDMVDDS